QHDRLHDVDGWVKPGRGVVATAHCLAGPGKTKMPARYDPQPGNQTRLGDPPMISRPNTALSQIHMQIMSSRLIAAGEELRQTLMGSALSTSVREGGDVSAGVFDKDGNMLAQAVTGTPGHVNSMAIAVRHFLDAFPLATMKPGDHYITNDPWLTCGHLHDLTVVSPTFLRGEPVG